jgi:ubiquinone/menaquinone biosynthesis C-methylase UbiE
VCCGEIVDKLRQAWSSFSPEIARDYLKTYGAPSVDSKAVLTEVLKRAASGQALRLIELGCGNGQLAEHFLAQGLDCEYTGVDFSEPLLAAARQTFAGEARVQFVCDDVENLKVEARYDYAIFSHVLELLPSPERALFNAKRVARRVVIRFYEPPVFEETRVELKEMDVGGGPAPFLRWKMGRDFYQLMLAKLGATAVDVYRSDSKDEVHVIYFDQN